MKIVFDASVMGLGVFAKAARTGIYRVTSQLLDGIMEANDVEISVVAIENLPEVLYFLATHYPTKKIEVLNDKKEVCNAKMELSLLKLFPLGSFFQKVIRKILLQFHPLLYKNKLDTTAIQTKDLYFSPFLPIPSELENIQKLILVHDVIPLLFPKLTTSWSQENMQKVIESFDQKTTVVCISESTKNDLLQVCQNKPSVQVIPISANTKVFKEIKDKNVIEKTLEKYQIPTLPYFLSVSTLEPRKNVESTIRSFGQLLNEHAIKDLNLILVGTKGWDFDSIFQEFKANEHLKKQIIFTGFVEDDDLAAIYSGALGFVFPTLYEGFGLPPLEAMLCGTPVISSNTSSIPEVVGDAGILIEPTNISAIADALFELYKNSELRANLKSKALEQAKVFSKERTIQSYLQLFKELQKN